MAISSVWRSLAPRDRRDIYIWLSLPIVGLAIVRTIKSLAFSHSASRILLSPRQSLQLSSKQDPDQLAYPPDCLPGARDVDTPYGSIRVYEWGPEEGRKVLCIHGISTPAIAFAAMAPLLVERGCRVMLFDLWGRGYSDTPDPRLYRQDIGLFTTQILLAVTSSKLAWTGSDRFSILGYSLGGGIAASFASHFPHLVESVVLIAPGGLLRPSHISWSSKLLYSNLLPESIVKSFVGRRLRDSSTKPPSVGNEYENTQEASTAPADVAESEVPDHPAHAKDSIAPLFPERPRFSIADAVSWQVDAHPGFLAAFISSIKYAPVSNEHERWRLVGARCAARRASPTMDELPGLDQNKVLIILGAEDPVIVADETEEDATAALGEENVKVVRIEGSHDVPVVNSQGCVDAITSFWDDSPV